MARDRLAGGPPDRPKDLFHPLPTMPSPSRTALLPLAALTLAAATLAGCATAPPPAPAPAALPSPPPPAAAAPASAPAVSVIDGYAWSAGMAGLALKAGEAAKAHGAVEVARTPDNRIMLRATGDAAFETGSSRLNQRFIAFLDGVAGVLAAQPSILVSIAGHTDSVGSAAANLRLSKERADAALAYLVAKGVAQARITAEGRGEAEPIAGNDTPAGRAENRRVEMLFFDPASN